MKVGGRMKGKKRMESIRDCTRRLAVGKKFGALAKKGRES